MKCAVASPRKAIEPDPKHTNSRLRLPELIGGPVEDRALPFRQGKREAALVEVEAIFKREPADRGALRSRLAAVYIAYERRADAENRPPRSLLTGRLRKGIAAARSRSIIRRAC
jgi:hypothetical protein